MLLRIKTKRINLPLSCVFRNDRGILLCYNNCINQCRDREGRSGTGKPPLNGSGQNSGGVLLASGRKICKANRRTDRTAFLYAGIFEAGKGQTGY